MSVPEPETPAEPANPVTSEDGLYEAVVGEYLGLRRAGAGIIAAAALAAAHLMYVQKANEA